MILLFHNQLFTRLRQRKITNLKQTRLFQYLESLDPDLSKNCLAFVNHVTPILQKIPKYFPFYTRHDDGHSLHIVHRMDTIVVKECLQKNHSLSFSATEAFLLICAAYGHDLGMAVLPGEVSSILERLQIDPSTSWNTNSKLQDYLRKTHSERGGKYIFDNIDGSGIPIALHQHLDLLMRSHNLSIDSLQSQLGKRFASESEEIDLQQLACILCIADLIEYSEDRVLTGVIDQLRDALGKNEEPSILISLQENLKHNGIGANLAVGKDGKIIITGSFIDPDVLSVAYRAIDLIEKWIRDYGDIDYRTDKKRLKIRTDSVIANFDLPGREFNRLGIRMNKQNVIGLISSNAIWNNRPEMIIRELLQNSVEACRYRSFYSQDSVYCPQVLLELNQKTRTITISDNGCGMSRSVVLNNFLTVGNSRAKEPGYAHNGYASLARFGIGFWSVFTIAEIAHIETCEHSLDHQENDNGFRFDVSISGLKEYTIFEKFAMTAGTRIILVLKENVNLFDLSEKISGHYGVIKCSKIPIKVSFNDKEESVPEEPVIPSLEHLFGPKTHYAQEQAVQIFPYSSCWDSVVMKTFIVARKLETTVSLRYTDGNSINVIPHISENCCVCGFSVNAIIDFPIHEILGSLVGYIANSNDPNGFEFDITRQSLLKSSVYLEYCTKIALNLIENYRGFLQDNNCHNPRDIVRLFEEGQNVSHGGTLDTTNRLLLLINIAPDLLCYKLHRIEPSQSLNTCEKEYLSFSELMSRKYRLVTISRMYSIHNINPSINFNELFDYELAKTVFDPNQPTYFVKRGESDLLFPNDPNSYVIQNSITPPGKGNIYHALFVSTTETVDPLSNKSWHIGSVQGFGWAGSVSEKLVLDGNFAFTHQRCFITPGSLLATDVRQLYDQGKRQEICQILNRLEASLFGFIDPEINKYL